MPAADPISRAAAMAALGHRDPLAVDDRDRLVAACADDPDARVRAAALAALVRAGPADDAARCWQAAVADGEAPVRRRAADLAPLLAARAPGAPLTPALVTLLGDDDIGVVEGAAWALGELGPATGGTDAVERLATVVTTHDDALAREAAVAALGSLGDRAGLPAILAACDDKPAVRRRAVLALAPFDGDAVDVALRKALEDRDWQVRQAAEDLLGLEAETNAGD